MSSTVAESPSTSPATSPTVSVGPIPSASSSTNGPPSGSGSELPPPTSTGSATTATSSQSMSSPASSELPPSTSSPIPTPSPSPSVPTSVPPSSTDPPMSSTTTPSSTSQPPDTSQPPSSATPSSPSTSPPSTSDPPPTTSQPPVTSTEPPSTTSPTSTSQPPETTSQPPSTTSTPPETTTKSPDTTTTTTTTSGRSSVLVVLSTYQSTVYITTTDEHGSTTLSAPSAFTSTVVSTNSLGEPITVTQIINNPTLIPNGGNGSASAFFRNKGAVAGVFVVVGLAATAIVFFILFWFRRRRKNRRLDHDTVVAATLAEHGFGRQSLIDADDDHLASDQRQRTVSTPSGSGSSADMRRASTPSMTLSALNTGLVSAGGYGRQSQNPPYLADSLGHTYNPYADNQAPYQNPDPGPSNSGGIPYFSLPSISGASRPFFSHGPEDSIGSNEPLLGGHSGSDSPPEPATPAIPPRNPLRLLGGAGSERGSSNGQGGGRVSNDESGGYEDDGDFEYEALRKRSLKVRNNPD